MTILGSSICEQCGAPSEEGAVPKCSRCPRFEVYYSCSRSACSYARPIRELIHEFKFHDNRRVRPFLFDLFNRGASKYFHARDFDAIVPVPLHPWRRFQREFNQAELLGRTLSEEWRIPLLPRAVKRIRMTPPQSRIPGRFRKENVRAAFTPGREGVAGARVLLVDDVMTTGQTLSACSESLVKAGAIEVVGYTLARRG